MINLLPTVVVVGFFWVSSICHQGSGSYMTVAVKPKTKFSFREALNYKSVARPLTEIETTVVSTFILFFLTVVGTWLLDEDYVFFKDSVTAFTKQPMDSLGWVQYWGLFSPEVRNQNYHSTALVEFADGTSKLYEFPRTKIDQKDYWSHFGGEKKRKLFGDCMPWQGWSQFLPSIARFIAQANNDPANPPRMVTIFWHQVFTPPPDPKHWVYRDQLPYHTQQLIKFIYKVDPKDLQSNNVERVAPIK